MPVYNPNDYNRENGSEKPRIVFLGAGKHRVKVKDHELGESSGGHGQVTVTFMDANGAQLRGYLIYTGRAGFQFAALLSAVDWSDTIDLDRPAEVRKAIYGKWLQIVVEEEDGKGRIKYYNKIAAGSGGNTYDKHERRGDPDPRDVQRDERQDWSRTGGGGEPPPPGDDDIPFVMVSYIRHGRDI